MSMDVHLSKLQERHATLEQQISKANQHPSIDSLELSEMKRRKLLLKEEIERLRMEPLLN
ncbi:MAG: YdcH family protein [Alphaproteobacteria bacterium]